MEENIRRIAEEMQGLSKVAADQYRSVVDDILNEKITNEQEIVRVMDI